MPTSIKEGWGITIRNTNEGFDFIVSDSTHVLKVVDPFTWNIKRQIEVKDCLNQPIN